MRESSRVDRLASRFGATSFGRSQDTWRRRDSFLLAGLLLFVDYFLAAILIVVDVNALGRVALAAGMIPILVYTVAEAMHGFRPTEASLARADLLALVAVGTTLAISVIIVSVGSVTGQLS